MCSAFVPTLCSCARSLVNELKHDLDSITTMLCKYNQLRPIRQHHRGIQPSIAPTSSLNTVKQVQASLRACMHLLYLIDRGITGWLSRLVTAGYIQSIKASCRYPKLLWSLRSPRTDAPVWHRS